MLTPSDSTGKPGVIGDADILDALAPPSDGSIGSLVIGVNWTLAAVQTRDGAGIGLAQTPSKSASNCAPLKDAGGWTGRAISGARLWAAAENPMERALGIAVLNAAWHARFLAEGRDNATTIDGLALAAQHADQPGVVNVLFGFAQDADVIGSGENDAAGRDVGLILLALLDRAVR